MAWFFVSRVAAALIAVITLFVLTRLLPAEDFARYNIVILSGMIAQQFAFNWIFTSITRFHSSSEFQGRTVAYGLGAAALATLVLLPLLAVAGFLVPEAWRTVYILTAAVAWSSAMHELGLACLRVQQRGPLFAVAAIVRPVLATSLAAWLLLRGGGYESAVVALILGSLVAGALGVAAAARSSGIRRPDRFSLGTFFFHGLPLSAVSSGAMLFPLASQLVLAALVGLQEVGYFAAAMTLSERSLTMLMFTLGQVSAATIFRAHETEGPDLLVKALETHFSFLLLIGTPLALVMLFAGGTLTRIFFSGEFAVGVAPFLSLLALSAFVNGIQGGFFAYIFEIRRRTLHQLGFAKALLVVHLAAAFLLIWAFGPFGAAYATIFTALASTALYAWYGRELFGRCSLLRPAIQIAVASAAAVPFLVAADGTAPMLGALALIAAGMLAMLTVLKLVRYESLETILDTVRVRITSHQ